MCLAVHTVGKRAVRVCPRVCLRVSGSEGGKEPAGSERVPRRQVPCGDGLVVGKGCVCVYVCVCVCMCVCVDGLVVGERLLFAWSHVCAFVFLCVRFRACVCTYVRACGLLAMMAAKKRMLRMKPDKAGFEEMVVKRRKDEYEREKAAHEQRAKGEAERRRREREEQARIKREEQERQEKEEEEKRQRQEEERQRREEEVTGVCGAECRVVRVGCWVQGGARIMLVAAAWLPLADRGLLAACSQP